MGLAAQSGRLGRAILRTARQPAVSVLKSREGEVPAEPGANTQLSRAFAPPGLTFSLNLTLTLDLNLNLDAASCRLKLALARVRV